MKSPHTWHRSHNAASLVREVKAHLTPEKTIETAKDFLHKLNDPNHHSNMSEEQKTKAEFYISNLCEQILVKQFALEKDEEMWREHSERRRRSKLDNFGSQVIPTYGSEYDSESEECAFKVENSDVTVPIDKIYYKTLPWFLAPIPHIFFCITMMAGVYGGAFMFLAIEPSLGEMPFIRLVLNCFDSGSRMGWGQLPPTSPLGRVVMTVYSFVIVSLVNGFIATVGNIMANTYCVHWPVWKAKWKGIKNIKVRDLGEEMSLKVAFSITVLMVLLAYYLWCYKFDNMGVVDVTYFSVMTMMAAAFGDVRTLPKTHTELFVIMIYFTVGIALWGGIFVLLTGYITDTFVKKCQTFLRWTVRRYYMLRYRKNENN
uniref:Ion_trans_2 domain-containing protein n=1 Tax=Bursaphelenchus xylophilus TaxID=6326 RepID=A0A1I7RV70_BURXY